MRSLLILLILLCAFSSYGYPYEKRLDICERYYEEGQYKKAYALCEKIIQKLSKERKGLAVAKVNFYKAKYLAALGEFKAFETVIAENLEKKAYKGKETLLYTKATIDVASLYLSYSDLYTAETYLQEFIALLRNVEDGLDKDGNPSEWYMRYQYFRTRAMIDLKRGEFDLVREILPALLQTTEKRMSGREFFYNEVSNRMDERKLGSYQQRRRKRQHAEVLLLKAQVERLSGNYELADGFLQDAEIWTKMHLNNKDLAFIKLLHERILLNIDKKKPSGQVQKSLEKLIFLAERRLGPVHKTFVAIHETLLDYYIAHYNPRSKIQQWELRTNMVRYFGKDKNPHAVSVRVDAKKDFFNKQFKQAKSALLQALGNEAKVPLNHAEREKILKLLYQVTLSQEQHDEALGYLKSLMDTQERLYGKESLPWHTTNMELAAYYMNFTSDFEAADSLMQQSFFGFIGKRIGEQHNDFSKYLEQFADYHEINGNYKGAGKFTDKILSIAQQRFGNGHIEYAIALEKKLDIKLSSGNFEAIDRQVDSLLYLFKKGYDYSYIPDYARALETSARFYAMMGFYQEADRLLNYSERLINRSVHASANSSAADELAYLYLNSERYKEAERLLNQVLEVRGQRYGKESRFLITPLSQKAALLNTLGQFAEAEQLVNQALAISQHIYGDSAWQSAEIWEVKADLQMAIGDFDLARESLQKVMAIQRKVHGDGHIEQAKTLNKLALITLSMGGDTQEAGRLLERSKELVAQNLGTTNPIYANSLMGLAAFYLATEQPGKVQGYADMAANIWYEKLDGKYNSNYAQTEMLKGKAALHMGGHKQAVAHFQEAAKLYKKVFNAQHPSYAAALSAESQVYHNMGKKGKAKKHAEKVLFNAARYIEEFFPALSEREKGKYWATIRSDFEFFNNLAFSNPNKKLLRQAYDNALATKSLLLSSSTKIRSAIYESEDEELITLYDRWTEKKELLTEMISMSSEQQKEAGITPKELGRELEQIEKQLSARSALFEANKDKSPVTWKSVRDALGKGEVAIELVRYRVYQAGFTDSVAYAALMLTHKSSAPELVLLPKGNAMETNYLQYFRYCIQYNMQDENSYAAFWQPIQEQIAKGSRVYLSPDGVYSQLNLEALPIDSGQYLIDQADISLVGSTADLVRKPGVGQQQEEAVVVLFGNPVFYSDLPPKDVHRYNDRPIPQLPGTEQEVRKLRDLARNSGIPDTRLYMNEDASEPVVKAVKSPKILHFATHGFFFPDDEGSALDGLQQDALPHRNPLLRSGLLFREAGDLMEGGNVLGLNKKDGVLTAYEAMGLHLDGTDLVVLSACETGRGDHKVGEGVYGLQRALTIAGAETIIMSLFKVSDEATQKLMETFYDNWLTKGMEKRKAFTEAKKQLRETFPDPLFWGPFIMIGSGR